MPTWLDQWCAGRRHTRRQRLRDQGLPPDQYCLRDGLAAREDAFDAFREATRLEEAGEGIPLHLAFTSIFAKFFIMDKDVPLSRSFLVTPELAAEMVNVIPTPESVAQTRALIGYEETIYIDIPTGTIAVGPFAELRAIFIEPWAIDLHEPGPNGEVEERVLRFCIVVAPRGQFGLRHLLWQDDRTNCVADNVPLPAGNANERATPTFDEILRGADLPVEQLQDDVERLAYVALARAREMELLAREREHGAQDGGPDYEEIPFLPADHPRRAPGRAGEVRDRFSLFHVRRLAARAPAAVREVAIERQPWQLGRRVTVKAHWRQQPVGPRGSGNRRRIWIAEHQKGPVAGLPRQPMQQL
jgi:hypothetical protein